MNTSLIPLALDILVLAFIFYSIYKLYKEKNKLDASIKKMEDLLENHKRLIDLEKQEAINKDRVKNVLNKIRPKYKTEAQMYKDELKNDNEIV